MSSVRVIGLITDFGLDDWFVGVMKSVMLSIDPSLKIVDLTHGVPRHSLKAAAFAILASYGFLPRDGIVVVVVDPGVGSGRPIICARCADRYFLAPDNGVLSPLFEKEGFERIVRVTNRKYFLEPVSSTFHGRDIFAPVAAHLAAGATIESLGPAVEDYVRLELGEAQFDGENLRVEIVWIDSFGNMITNCPSDLIARVVSRVGDRLLVEDRNLRLRLVDYYESAEERELIGIVGSTGNLEISVRLGSAARLLNCGVGDTLSLRKVG